ncbi:MAG: YciI family protein [Bacteroidia bacterium]
MLYTIGENWDTTKEAYEQNYFKEHSSHLAELRNKGKISIGGRFSDTGMLLLNASDLNEAKNLIEKDIAIQNKLFTVEIFYFDAFYKGCIE